MLLAVSLLALAGRAILYWTTHPALAHGCWSASAILMAAALLVESAIHVWRRELSLDMIALLVIVPES